MKMRLLINLSEELVPWPIAPQVSGGGGLSGKEPIV